MHELFREMLYYRSRLSKSEELDEGKVRKYEERYDAILDTAPGKLNIFQSNIDISINHIYDCK